MKAIKIVTYCYSYIKCFWQQPLFKPRIRFSLLTKGGVKVTSYKLIIRQHTYISFHLFKVISVSFDATMTFLTQIADTQIYQRIYPLIFLLVAFAVAVVPFTLHVMLHPFTYILSTAPLSVRLRTARSKFFYYSWRVLSPLLDPVDEPMKRPLLAKGRGVVLEIGAGVGDNIKYYDRRQVERLILVEPNADMHPLLRAKANASGYKEMDASLLLLGCGGAASDELALEKAGIGAGSVDTIMVIHVLCSIPGPAEAVELYRRLLKPGGQLVFCEHVKNEERTTAQWQTWYTKKIWRTAFDGCELDRPTGEWIVNGPNTATNGIATSRGGAMINGAHLEAGGALKKRWREYEIKAPDDQNKYSLIPHVVGWATKA